MSTSEPDDFDPAAIAAEYAMQQFLEWVETGIRNGWLEDPMVGLSE
jgi:hypothetical protein